MIPRAAEKARGSPSATCGGVAAERVAARARHSASSPARLTVVHSVEGLLEDFSACRKRRRRARAPGHPLARLGAAIETGLRSGFGGRVLRSAV